MPDRKILVKAKNYYIEHAFSVKVEDGHGYRSTIVTKEYPGGIAGWSETPIEHWVKSKKRLEIYDDSKGGKFKGVKGKKWQLADSESTDLVLFRDPQYEVKQEIGKGSILHEMRALLYEIRDKLS